MDASRPSARLDLRELGVIRPAFGPFTPGGVTAVVGANILACLMALSGWWGCSGKPTGDAQLAWLNLSIGGVMVAGLANGVFLARARRGVVLARRSVLGSAVADNSSAATRPIQSNGRSEDRATHGALVAVPGALRYHRHDCLLIQGKAVVKGSPPAHLAKKRIACEVCAP